ncbi:nitrite reductase small subunit NirD [Sulfuriferula thiophila]|uniref:nitrite reductase small subunit NirD n=1 Tax=Sulfuriferula thiophila TaxID=1781211 RepID=UPI000F610616|nr:nitrite reductase small subunit NirD [Sulfuriferula thiophila]
MSNWTQICSLSDIPNLGSRVVQTTQGDIAVFRTDGDEVFALHDKCPHKGGPLSQGIVAGKTVTCPLHGWKIGLQTGDAEAPDEGHVACLQTKIDEAGVVWLGLTAKPAC